MKKNLFYLFPIVLVYACGNTEQTTTESTTACLYNYNQDSTQISWTAYKFTEKAGVKGSFTSFSLAELSESSEHVYDIFRQASFLIQTTSLATGDSGRDEKIRQHFFGNMQDTETISGKVINITEDGKMQLLLRMNGVEKEVNGSLQLNEDTLLMQATLYIEEFNAGSALEALNKECVDLHKGADGNSVLWPEVFIQIRTVLHKTCD